MTEGEIRFLVINCTKTKMAMGGLQEVIGCEKNSRKHLDAFQDLARPESIC